jgi:hypothetical protein
MKIAIAVLALVAGFAASPAFAQAAAPADLKAVTDCLKKGDESGQFGGGCIGIVADPCIKAAGGKNTDWEDSKKCAARENAVWLELSKRALKDVEKGGFKKVTDAATEAQKTFAQSRDKLCPVYDGLDPGMVMGGANYCRLQEMRAAR